MPPNIIKIMSYTPFIMATDLLRKVMFFNMSIQDVNGQFFIFVGMTLCLLALMGIVTYVLSVVRKLRANMIAKRN
jgi:hypothetical protein